MKKSLAVFSAVIIVIALFNSSILMAQNIAPYWSLTGNSNATAASKLGTTNAINLGIFTNNLERMRINTAGQVGIGTTAPGARLHINSAAGTDALRVQINGATKLLVHSAGGVSIGANINPPANGLYVAGKIGIGTATSSYNLHVVGSTFISNVLNVGNGGIFSYNSAGTGVYGSGSNYGIYGTSTSSGIGVYGTGYTYGVQGYSSSSTGVYGDGSFGVYGRGTNTGIYGTGSSYGVQGNSSGGYGVYSSSYSGIAVYGTSNSNIGGYFYSALSHGIWAATSSTAAGAYAGVFQGNVFTYNAYITSDKNLKKNIQEFGDAMSIINKLKPKNYEFRNDGKYASLQLPKGNHYGLLAQELEEVLPSLVRDAPLRMNNSKTVNQPAAVFLPDQSGGQTVNQQQEVTEVINTKGVNYIELIPIVIKGMQELNAENKNLKEEISLIKQELADLRQVIRDLKNGRTEINTTKASAYLEQNIPNPVTGNTIIRYQVPVTATSAKVTITNAAGQLIKTIMIVDKGAGQFNFNSTALAAGTYHYSLWVEGKQADTKRLIIAR
jgi:flagellar hook assembly protein FlgD